MNDFLNGLNETHREKVISIFPNPFSESATISVSGSEFPVSDLEMKLYDVYGRLVFNTKPTARNTQLARGCLSAGLYFYKIETEKKFMQTGKLTID